MKNVYKTLIALSLVIAMLLISSCDMLKPNQATDKNNNVVENGGGDTLPDNIVGDGNQGIEDDNQQDNTPPVDTSLYLPITENGEAKIKIISAYSKDKAVFDAISEFKAAFTDIIFEEGYTTSNIPSDREILIGDSIGAEGNLYIDPHSLGDEGYAICVIGNKIIVAGGNTESLVAAIKMLSDDILKLSESDTKNISISREVDILHTQTYPIKGITVEGNDIASYDIVCDTRNESLMKCAQQLHNTLYNKAGYWTEIKASSYSPSIRIVLSDYAGNGGFMVYVDGEDLIIKCAYPVLMEETFDKFIDTYFGSDDERTIKFESSLTFSLHISTISYCTYGGAVGDGIADDFDAIQRTHNRANVTGQTVIADPGKIFNLGQHTAIIKVQTNTIWTDATFIIDDSDLGPDNPVRGKNLFWIAPDNAERSISGISSLSKGQTNVGVTFDGPMLLQIVNREKYQYIRYGANADNGAYQQEIILVDKDGNVDPSTPILWDYETLSQVVAYRADEKPISIIGGHFITIANNSEKDVYYYRGISITRSNVIMKDQVHTIEGEGDIGGAYYGFLNVSYATNVLFDSIVFTGHKKYGMGTYDTTATCANNVTWYNCTQTNSINDSTYWGVMGSNYCKNLTYDSCVLSRFDAHKGTHNATIINCEIGHQKINAIGSGVLLIENTIIHGNNVVNLRSDYGSTWEGDVILRDITLDNTSNNPVLISASWNNHYFGYTCYMPENVIIDGITLTKGTSFKVFPALSNDIDKDIVNDQENLNPYVITKKVIIESNPHNYSYVVSTNKTLFADVVVEENK